MRKHFFKGINFFAVIFFIGLIAGTIFVNFAKSETIAGAFIYTDAYFETVQKHTAPYYVVVTNILKHGLRFYLLLFLASFTKWKQIGRLIYCIYFGFSLGVILAALTIQYGLIGILIFLACILGQFLCYVLTTVVLLSGNSYAEDFRRTKQYRISFLFLFIGMLLEFVNQIHFLPRIIQLVV